MPQNFLWLEFIAKAIPDAKIIHTVRDPRAVCWSIFKTYFSSPRMHFSFDKSNIVKYFKLYKALMTEWERKFPDRIYLLEYESLIADQETETRRLFDYLGLSWEDSVMEFHQNSRSVRTASAFQVRQKIYSGSSEKWKSYEKWLAPAFNQLEDFSAR